MVFEQEFYYNGHLRWSLGWPTPSHAGAFVAMLVVCTWLTVQGRRAFAVTAAVEAVLYFLLAKTYSRGAMVALVAAALLFIYNDWFVRRKADWSRWVYRAFLVLLFSIGTGFSGRLAPLATGGDGAVKNRIYLWKEGIRMIASAPISGWGAGESGREFTNWFQDPNRHERYDTMVNSYVDLGVQCGAAALFGSLFAVIVISASSLKAAAGARRCGSDEDIASAEGPAERLLVCGSVCLVWGITNFFATLWHSFALWLLPLTSAAYLVFSIIRNISGYLTSIVVSLVLAALTTLLVVLWGQRMSSAESICVHRSPNARKTIYVANRNAIDGQTWEVWPDRTVLGFYPGIELRHLLQGSPSIAGLRVHTSGTATDGNDDALAPNLLIFGRNARAIGGIPNGTSAKVWIVHPLVACPTEFLEAWARLDERVKRSLNLVVVLPEIDETGSNIWWSKWASANHAVLKYSKGRGVEFRDDERELLR